MHEADIERAAQVHYSFLPENYSDKYLDIAVYSQPLNKIGGDFCSILPVDEKRIILCMCDTVGHGIPSALYAARVNTYVLTHGKRYESPCDLINALNEFLCQRLSSTGMYTTFCSIFIDVEKKEIALSGAAHPPVLYFSLEKREHELLPSETTFLGFEDPLPIRCAVHRRTLQTRNKLLLFTDGLTELKNLKGELSSTNWLTEFTKTHHTLNSAEFNKALFGIVKNNNDLKINDDILLMTVTVK
jgi:sigma-B regulation protein RsbU (phosphoserine phosphatase)